MPPPRPSPASGGRGPEPRRSFSLLEAVIVLAILIAIGALVLPVVMDELSERAFDTAVDATRQQLLLARAHAQTTGGPVEVAYLPDERRIVVRDFDPAAAAVELDEDVGAVGVATLDEPWAQQPLPADVELGVSPPGAEDDALDLLRLAVFMPDGSALLGEPAWLFDADGRQGRLIVNPWSGVPSFEGGDEGSP